jgi:hypothetical protein
MCLVFVWVAGPLVVVHGTVETVRDQNDSLASASLDEFSRIIALIS